MSAAWGCAGALRGAAQGPTMGLRKGAAWGLQERSMGPRMSAS